MLLFFNVKRGGNIIDFFVLKKKLLNDGNGIWIRRELNFVIFCYFSIARS